MAQFNGSMQKVYGELDVNNPDTKNLGTKLDNIVETINTNTTDLKETLVQSIEANTTALNELIELLTPEPEPEPDPTEGGTE